VEEAKNYADPAYAALRWWTSKKDTVKAREAAATFLMAVRQAGELLEGLEKDQGGYAGNYAAPTLAEHSEYRRTPRSEYRCTLDENKLSEQDARRWQRLARHWSLPALETYIDECYQCGTVPTLHAQLKQIAVEEKRVTLEAMGNWHVERADVAEALPGP
jgi:hypothetical protein